ncbi:hypothetical protein MXB_498 [Myxobolus squamalis]|nr:hypothetical protein MXB_498 [Myxobolus squamalis]
MFKFLFSQKGYLLTLKNREIAKITRDQSEYKSKTSINDADLLYEASLLDSARYNSLLLNEKCSSRFYSIDLQSFVLRWPQNTPRANIKFVDGRDPYPISLIPNQYKFLVKKPGRRRGRKPKIPFSPILSVPLEVEVDNPADIEDPKEDIICSECLKSLIGEQNFITCSKCHKKCTPVRTNLDHAACMDVSLRLIEKIGMYDWSCYYCKKCVICNEERSDVGLLDAKID